MASRYRLLLVFLVTGLFLFPGNLKGPKPAAGDEVDLATVLSDDALSEDTAEYLVDTYGGNGSPLGGDSFNQSDYDQCPTPIVNPTWPPVTYKTFTRLTPPIQSVNLSFDEYDPPVNDPTYPYSILLLAHGGSFWRGCKLTLQDVAMELSGNAGAHIYKPFIVLSFDYRLACHSDDPNLLGSPIRLFCDYKYDTVDSPLTTIGPATHDVQDAVTWVGTNWPTLPGRPVAKWDGRIVLLGTSAGATLVYNAVAPSPNVGRAVSASAIAAWSADLEFNQMSSPNVAYPCETSNQTNALVECRRGTHNYLHCNSNWQVYPDPLCQVGNPDRYEDASANTWYTSTSLPHAFFANGGGPVAGVSPPELVALQEAKDFEQTLVQRLGWHNGTEYRICVVDQQAHGRALRGWPCDDPGNTETVMYLTGQFLYENG